MGYDMAGSPGRVAVSATPDNQLKSSAERSQHPYLAGNFYPVRKEFDLVACSVLSGSIPEELAGGQYLRNGGNAFHPPAPGQGYHFFDGDGMIHGVFFRKEADGSLVPCYVNKFVQTDVLFATKKRGSTLIPTIASLIAPISSYPIQLLMTMLRTVFICYLSSLSRLSVANTLVTFHNKKLLATCESGPMMRLQAPELETRGWEIFLDEETGEGLGKGKQVVGKKLGKSGQMLEEWTTGHPKVCPVTGDLVFYGYNIFAAPFVTHSVVRADGSHSPSFKTPVPGVSRPKMMHDFAVSLNHSIILDLPLTMDPLNIAIGRPMLSFNRSLKSRFAILPRYYDGSDPSQVTWFEDDEPSLIFHTADAWDEGLTGNQYDPTASGEAADELVAVNMYACRFRTSKLVYAAGGMDGPANEELLSRELSDTVRVTYFRFSLSDRDPLRPSQASAAAPPPITHAFALSAIALDFPVVSHAHSMQQHRFVYGCTMREGQFDSALEGAKVDCIVKLDAESLRRKGIQMADEGKLARFDPVDTRGVLDVLAQQEAGDLANSDIRIFDLPHGVHGQEPALVLKKDAKSEDDAYLVFYAYDESQLLPNGDAPDDSHSHLYIVDAALMGTVPTQEAIVAVIDLPSRVPYGLHAGWITAEQIESQIREHNSPDAAVIQEVALQGDVKPRLRSQTVSAADRKEEMERELQSQAGARRWLAEASVTIWISSMFWLLLQHLRLAPSEPSVRPLKKGRAERDTSPCISHNDKRPRSSSATSRPGFSRRRTASIVRPHLARVQSDRT